MNIQTDTLFKQLINKGILKQKVYTNTLESRLLFKQEVLKLAGEYENITKAFRCELLND
ncbi:MAG: hypothetical protein PF484_05320 [Bacteroidales bacterium]|jgi:hypothetical protein|nr:hypothetical protein [Bacteroidales bacterium]